VISRFEVQQISNLFALDWYPRLIKNAGWEPRDQRSLLRACQGSEIFAAFLGDQCVGMVRVTGDLVYTALICDLIVESKFRREGIGTRLMEAVLSYCRDLGVSEVYAVVDWNAKGFYYKTKERMGSEWMEAWRWQTGSGEL